ncbi:MSMEG_0570 family nitrogen starvation response protein [Aquabacterium soli]|jgi:uncharacterized repeat protein (TIGR04042 family)|uniref:MSMEG_0570 family nitrogen starvation response protein n=1 Tax=Aquabacterium soli TaxID=2493092 RepID=A0A3R8TSJ1_9BURK|nr:MSMEG_0570 family nitrogen starvation response protein [Aquabacterium soli]RRS03891.1 MSMEG_0570 family nitrogen starvation response protein [Aquabacterium soli]
MPEMLFQVRWPDGSDSTCYSPSLVVQDYLTPGGDYPLDDFLNRTREALEIASERVRAKYGFACSRAMDQWAEIDETATRFKSQPDARVRVIAFQG